MSPSLPRHAFYCAIMQDQLRAMRAMCEAAFGAQAPPVDVYDGDTPQSDRQAIRARVQLLITNPDMLHMSILPIHSTFARFLRKLCYIVVDEGHAYRGVFGTHTAFVLRRLRRLCRFAYGSTPRVAVTSATVANPAAAMRSLLGLSDSAVDAPQDRLVVVQQDGSPHGPSSFVLWNPPLAQQVHVERAGACVCRLCMCVHKCNYAYAHKCKYACLQPLPRLQAGLMYDGEDGRFKRMTRTEAKFKAGASKYAQPACAACVAIARLHAP